MENIRIKEQMQDCKQGDTLGDFNLIKQIGHGSLGTLFLAQQRFTKKKYALKMLPEELTYDKVFCQRFEEEIAALADIDHPHIVKTNTVSFAQGCYFLTEEFIVDPVGESCNLWNYFCAHNKNLPEASIIIVATQLAKALDWAHEKKMVHRGVKWNNILIGSSIQPDLPLHLYLSDFGLSKLIGPGAVLTRSFKAQAEALSLSPIMNRYPVPAVDPKKLSLLHSSFLQNFLFLAPEQKRAEVEGDEKIDVYAFGVLMYVLLTGEYPEGIFPLPSDVRRDLSCNWDLLVTECLKKEASYRPKSLTEILCRATTANHLTLPSKPLQQQEERLIEPQFQVADVSFAVQQFDLFSEQNQRSMAVLPTPDRAVKEYHPEKREIRIVQPLVTEMVAIPKDEYYRGSNYGCRDEMPRHLMRLQGFSIDIHPVTNEQFVRFMESMGEEKDLQNHDIIRLRESRIKKSSGKYSIEPGYAKHPVVGVTWYGACAYANWIGKRLPTEAEWEVACCGKLENPLYPTGETIEKTQANFFSSDTTAVMSYPPNGLGLYDMAGNVYEWCQDWYDYSFYESASQEPDAVKGPHQGVYRVLRGGCWKSLKEDLRCSKRHRNNPGAANGTYGFRCAHDG